MKIGLIGCGRMGGALIEGAITAGLVASSDVLLSSRSKESAQTLADKCGAVVAENNSQVARESDLVLLGCKPYQIIDILNEISAELPGDTCLVSVAAGITLQSMEGASPEGTRIIRAMPNTPSLIGMGATGISKGSHATDADIAIAQKLLGSVGIVLETREDQLDAVTGVSGSGPAYVYTFIEELAAQGVKEGLDADDALQLATQTVIGAARMVEQSPMSPAELRNQVTSPGGTTLAGLKALTDSGFEKSVATGVAAAAARSREIAAES
ncbi:pyrroline-5-carboxylate reductase [Verrucomicrobiaceae bacterium R5-34]|uniref:Pyrroline-5-carboxylate reductase n=1 Tax=Oceaniferula flava TaxID=2800421 RepID=A0AAE2S932_9BACT|nr:pyrroline-5-carboxylate reductase [Oceaniferula flavus]MBK1829673.1 pyrroline-5-carboxylate reductase [Verrucomicrobiaceae bacterium R5-34]MBK1853863.1 pyrroline-5-carboxylate reductase [Oceaniferula flavus]MBM1135169.1 pyrroline-5-carboxylate reductase [Oceaniferula flavus]